MRVESSLFLLPYEKAEQMKAEKKVILQYVRRNAMLGRFHFFTPIFSIFFCCSV